jgi:hypothetical protein
MEIESKITRKQLVEKLAELHNYDGHPFGKIDISFLFSVIETLGLSICQVNEPNYPVHWELKSRNPNLKNVLEIK